MPDDVQKLPLDPNLQKEIIKLMLIEESFLLKCSIHLKADYFEDRYHNWLFDRIVKLYSAYQVVPTVGAVRTEIMKFSAEERPSYDRVFDRILDIETVQDDQYLRDQLTAFAKRAYFLSQMEGVKTLYDRGNQSDAVNLIHKISDTLQDIKFDKDDLFDYDDLDNLLYEVANSATYRIPLGIPHIDQAMMGGMDRRDAMAFLGPMNAGKSFVLLNVARNLILRGKKVLFINLENIITQFMCRMLSSMTSVPFSKFHSTTLTQQDKNEIAKARGILKERFMLKNWYDYGVLAEDLYTYCSRLKLKSPFDVIIIDYAGLLKVGKAMKSNMAKFDYMQEVGNILASMARKLETPVITAVQGNRDAQKKSMKGELLRVTDIADCFGFTRPMGSIITLTKSDDDRDSGTLKFLLDKERNGKTGVAVAVKTDLDRCLVLDDSLSVSRILTKSTQGSDGDD